MRSACTRNTYALQRMGMTPQGGYSLHTVNHGKIWL
jgi:hypothetical protein